MDESQELSSASMTPGPSRPHLLTVFLPTPPAKNGKSACITRVQPVHLKQYWKIENFATVAKLALPGNCLRSNVFRDAALPEACWQLCLYPGGKRLENANNVSLFLKMSSTSPTREVRIKVEYRFYFLNDSDQPLFSNVNVGEFHAKPPKGGHSWGLRNIPRQKVLNCVREDGTLVISCHIELIPDINRVKCYAAKEVLLTPTTPVCTGFVRRQVEALENGALADCELECNGQVIPVNKFMLSTHSKVFSAMFSHDDVQESKEKKVIMKDTDIDSVRMMLRYMYCGEVDLESSAEGVMVLAERYQMDELKQLCEEKLCSLVDKNNIAEMLYLADLYNCPFLKTAVVDVLRINKAYVMGTQSWQMLKESNPKLMNEVMERVVLGAETASPPPNKRQRQHFSSILTAFILSMD
uniref:Non-specific serine/threonine protein kinase n=1 Tax=Parascaris univalens TaxID=6257 RepID=A0A915ABU8_PARUN